MSGTILLAHGGGGQLTDELLEQVVRPRLGNPLLDAQLDSGMIPLPDGTRLALTTDSYVVQPWEFPGGNIGRLAVCGTVNDLAVCGAKVLGLGLSLILAEGLEKAGLERVMDAVAQAAKQANVRIITGDTKVVGRGAADGLYITTCGIGLVPAGVDLSPMNVRQGDVLLINGPIGEHGLAVMMARQMPQMVCPLQSDSAPLNGLMEALLAAAPLTRFARDATRGGVAGLCADLAKASGKRIVLREADVPVTAATRRAAEVLGIDVLEVANEGKLVAVVAAEQAEAALGAMRSQCWGKGAAIIGQVGAAGGICEMVTNMGGRRIVQKPYGEQLPRIC